MVSKPNHNLSIDLSDLTARELVWAGELIQQYVNEIDMRPNPQVLIRVDRAQGVVYLVNGDGHIYMQNGSGLERYYGTPKRGYHGFAADLCEELEKDTGYYWPKEDIKYLIREGVIDPARIDPEQHPATLDMIKRYGLEAKA